MGVGVCPGVSGHVHEHTFVCMCTNVFGVFAHVCLVGVYTWVCTHTSAHAGVWDVRSVQGHV